MVIEGGSWSSRPVTCQSERVLPWGGQSTRVTDRLMTTDSTSRLAGIRSLFDPVDAMRPYRYIECTVIIDHSYQYWAQDTKTFFPNLPGRVRNSHEINERNIPSFCTKSTPPPRCARNETCSTTAAEPWPRPARRYTRRYTRRCTRRIASTLASTARR